MANTVQLLTVGRMGYSQALKLQLMIRNQVKEKKLSDTLIIVEHNPVYTIGIRDKQYDETEKKRLIKLGAEFYKTDRGGLITFHGPGQLVAYPVLDLQNYNPSVRWYVHNIEQTVIDLCSQYDLKAYTSTHTGVWVNDCKICAIGIHVKRYITTHGLALNCNTDLKWFSHIVPCGIQGKSVTSLTEQVDRDIGIQEVLPKFLNSFSKLFNCQIVKSTSSLEELKQFA